MTAAGLARIRPAAAPSWCITAALAAAWLLAGPHTPDLAAQVHRVDLFAGHGFLVWDNSWYDGHHVPGYSLLFPALAALVGPRLLGAVAAVASAALFAALLGDRRGMVAARWFAVGCVADLVIGRLTYALGVTAGLAALVALARARPVLAAALAAACAAISPVAGLFLALAATAWAIAERRVDALATAAIAAAAVTALGVAFPEGGSQPFSAVSFAETLAITLAAAVAVRGRPALRLGLGLYAASAAASFALATPMGANVTRLGTAFIGPIVVFAARPSRGRQRAAVAVLALAIAAWELVDPVTQGARAVDDPSAHSAYYRPLLAALADIAPDASAGRLEIPFTRGHWESVYVARRYALARGWERQLDRRLNPLFYRRRLAPAAYARWLRANAIRYVALPDVPMDAAGRAEAELVGARPAFLRPVWAGRHWRLFAVRDPLAIADGPAERVRLDPGDVRFDMHRRGAVLLRVHWTPYWRLTPGHGCVAPRGQWTVVRAARPGPERLIAELSVDALIRRHAACR